MNDSYYEQYVTGKPESKTYAMGIGLTVVAIAGMAASLVFSIALIVVIAAIAILIMYVFPRLQVEYEYIIVNSDLDITAIYKKQNRKKMMSVDLKTLEEVKPYDKNKPAGQAKVVNYSDKTGSLKTYEMIQGTGQQRTAILISPDANMLKHIKSWCGMSFREF